MQLEISLSLNLNLTLVHLQLENKLLKKILIDQKVKTHLSEINYFLCKVIFSLPIMLIKSSGVK